MNTNFGWCHTMPDGCHTSPAHLVYHESYGFKACGERPLKGKQCEYPHFLFNSQLYCKQPIYVCMLYKVQTTAAVYNCMQREVGRDLQLFESVDKCLKSMQKN